VRILLVSTYELGHQPLHVASPAARLLAAGHEVETLDLAIDSFRDSLLDGVDALAVSVPMHTAMRLAQRVIERVSAASPELPIAVYGLYADMGSIDGVDRVIVGEYEQELESWAESVAAGRPKSGGVSVDIGRKRFLVPHRSGLPPLDSYAHLSVGDDHRRVGYVEASHGCRHRCRHCPLPVVYDGRFRIVEAGTVLGDIDNLVSSGARHITFGDPDFFNGPAHAMKVLRSANDRHPVLTFDVTIKVEHLLEHRHLLGELAERNVLFVTSAFESTNDEVLALLDKGHTRQDMHTALQLCRSAGLDIHPSWLPFTPWTTSSDLAEIFSFIDEFDLFEVTEPVQLAIRLLIPRGSLVLDIPGVWDLIGDYDERALSYVWRSGDPSVDDLQTSLAARAEQHAAGNGSLTETLVDMWTRALETAGTGDVAPQIPAGAITGRPRLTEPWFC
jgi:radical SAM superfamily enzyme YgiQ (UPF0313 family)